jgi:hypothetical protein
MASDENFRNWRSSAKRDLSTFVLPSGELFGCWIVACCLTGSLCTCKHALGIAAARSGVPTGTLHCHRAVYTFVSDWQGDRAVEDPVVSSEGLYLDRYLVHK